MKELISLKINDYCDREIIVSILARNGYLVTEKEVKIKNTISSDFYIVVYKEGTE